MVINGAIVSDIAIFVLKRDVKLQLTNYKRRPGNFYCALFFHMWFSLLWKFYWAGAWAHEYTKLRIVSLRNVNSLTCIGLYFFLSPDPFPAGQ